MRSISTEIAKPKNDTDFEDMCADVYGVVFSDKTPKRNGSRGYKQGGVDLFVNDNGERIGIQCKRYEDGKLSLKHIKDEIKLADEEQQKIIRFIIATTAKSNPRLVASVEDISEQRKKCGLFQVDIEFWEEIEGHIKRNPALQALYLPNAPGGMFHEHYETSREIKTGVAKINARMALDSLIPPARQDALNKTISRQLDVIHSSIKTYRYRDAMTALAAAGHDLGEFDEHQKARWYLLRGVCHLHAKEQALAITDFFNAADIYPDDDKMAAAKVRALLLQQKVDAALDAATVAVARFPQSAAVWVIFLNAKMMKKEWLSLHDISPLLRTNEDVLHILAWMHQAAGKLEEAVELAHRAADLDGHNFLACRSALALSLEAATQEPIKSAYHFISEGQSKAIQRAIDRLTPWHERLWPIQSSHLVTETAEHIGMGLLQLANPQQALLLSERALELGVDSALLKRIALLALRDLDQPSELLRCGKQWLEDLDEVGLIVLAETAGNSGKAELVVQIRQQLKTLEEIQPKSRELINGIHWQAQWKSQRDTDKLLEAAIAFSQEDSTSLYETTAVAGVLFMAGKKVSGEEVLAKAITLSEHGATDQELLILADLLCYLRKYALAAPYYARFVQPGFLSNLHENLLECYVKNRDRKKARKLIRDLPSNWTSNDKLRILALEWGQQVEDLAFVERLVEVELQTSPNNGGAWLLQLQIAASMRKLPRVQALVSSIPPDLVAEPHHIMRIAWYELNYNEKVNGMKRLYRLVRRNMGSYEVATSFMSCLLRFQDSLPFMEDQLGAVADGTTVLLVDDAGNELVVSIDMKDAGNLPSYQQFYSASDPTVLYLMGRLIGDAIELPSLPGATVLYRIKHIQPICRHLFVLSQAIIDATLTQSPSIWRIPIPETDNGPDLSHMHALLRKRAENTAMVMDEYPRSALTLNALARLLGNHIVECIVDWPQDMAPIFVCLGDAVERKAAHHVFQRQEQTFVIDAATITELVWLDSETVLGLLPKVICSQETLSQLLRFQETESNGDTNKRVFVRGGPDDRIQVITFNADQIKAKATFCQRLLDTIDNFCTVVPVLGPDDIPAALKDAETKLPAEDYAALLLVGEYQASMLTLDGRLGMLAKALFGQQYVWPQELLRHAFFSNTITMQHYHQAVVKEFCSNRFFVSLSTENLLYLCLQGTADLQQGIRTFKRYLSSPTIEIYGVMQIIADFLEQLLWFAPQLKAFIELFGHLIEAIFRNPKSKNVEVYLTISIHQLIERLSFAHAGRRVFGSTLYSWEQYLYEGTQYNLTAELDRVRERILRGDSDDRPIKLKQQMGYNPPRLAFDD